MKSFDTDIYSDLVKGVPPIVARMATVPVKEQFLPVVVVEEVFRGRLSEIRKAQTGGSRITLERAYELFANSLEDLRGFQILRYTAAADAVYRTLVAAKIRIGTRDLRIASICISHNAKLVSRNKRDHELVPGLNLEVWN